MTGDTYYTTCKYCGANLDPNETCDCWKNANPALSLAPEMLYSTTHNTENLALKTLKDLATALVKEENEVLTTQMLLVKAENERLKKEAAALKDSLVNFTAIANLEQSDIVDALTLNELEYQVRMELAIDIGRQFMRSKCIQFIKTVDYVTNQQIFKARVIGVKENWNE